MKNKKRKYILLIIIVILFIGIITIYNNYNNDIYVDKDNNLSNSGLSLMVETKAGSGEYTISTSDEWPTNGYEFNAEKSACENGGTLSWDEENQSVVMTSKSSDKCYAYFDIVPPDVTIAVNNLPATYGKLGNINCNKSDAIYNQKYNRVEISNINAKYDNCILNYTDNTSKVNFADYIIGLAGTTQGNGEVVSEIFDLPDWNNTTAISEDSYTSQSIFSTPQYSSDQTEAPGVFAFANNTWTSVKSAMTSGTYYHFEFNPSESGYYKICYNLSKGDYSNSLTIYINTTQTFHLTATTYSDQSDCIALGYVSTSDFIKIKQGAFTTISTLSFSVQKVNDVQENIDAGIRYQGKNPDNYVWFNNEYWRIIGVFNESSHGQNGKNMVKIIRDQHLGSYAWDRTNVNDWSSSSLNLLLNSAYYNAQDGTDSGYCYGYGRDTITDCDYTRKGLQTNYRNMVANATWYLGGYTGTATPEILYTYERGTTVYDQRPVKTTGYIGLMYASDYTYSVLASDCARTTNIGSYGSSCAGQNWLYQGFEWVLTPSSLYGSLALRIWPGGGVGYGDVSYGVYNGYAVRPTLYLREAVNKISGNGTLESPYVIGM